MICQAANIYIIFYNSLLSVHVDSVIVAWIIWETGQHMKPKEWNSLLF